MNRTLTTALLGLLALTACQKDTGPTGQQLLDAAQKLGDQPYCIQTLDGIPIYGKEMTLDLVERGANRANLDNLVQAGLLKEGMHGPETNLDTTVTYTPSAKMLAIAQDYHPDRQQLCIGTIKVTAIKSIEKPTEGKVEATATYQFTNAAWNTPDVQQIYVSAPKVRSGYTAPITFKQMQDRSWQVDSQALLH